MSFTDMLSNIVAVIIFIGGPIIPLLFIAFQVADWHHQITEPVMEEEGHGH
ncbi:MAG: hypothetical protein IT322_17585 [Anaerolineae bacterium]|nr:hypothetical protein [Anaerolineae bacterium]